MRWAIVIRPKPSVTTSVTPSRFLPGDGDAEVVAEEVAQVLVVEPADDDRLRADLDRAPQGRDT